MVKTQQEYRDLLEERLNENLFKKVGLGLAGLAAAGGLAYGASRLAGAASHRPQSENQKDFEEMKAQTRKDGMDALRNGTVTRRGNVTTATATSTRGVVRPSGSNIITPRHSGPEIPEP